MVAVTIAAVVVVAAAGRKAGDCKQKNEVLQAVFPVLSVEFLGAPVSGRLLKNR